MEKQDVNAEQTTTIHLGLRTVSDLPTDPVDAFLSQLPAQERHLFESILEGGSDKAMIVIHRGPSRGARFLITSDGASIGRATTADIFLDDITVSRNHAHIDYRDGAFFYKDSGSLNGSYINNQSASDQQLHAGDEIQIGKFHVLFISARGSK
jgi:hypothetical protein